MHDGNVECGIVIINPRRMGGGLQYLVGLCVCVCVCVSVSVCYHKIAV